jgi:hypothetical protein
MNLAAATGMPTARRRFALWAIAAALVFPANLIGVERSPVGAACSRATNAELSSPAKAPSWSTIKK